MPTEEWHRIKKYIKVLTDQIRYNNIASWQVQQEIHKNDRTLSCVLLHLM
jgi:hypothetical protein